jgi:hypothetical protein
MSNALAFANCGFAYIEIGEIDQAILNLENALKLDLLPDDKNQVTETLEELQ